MLEQITKRFSNIFSSLTGKGKISEGNIQDAIKELKVALLEADVNLKVVDDFTTSVLRDAIGQKVIENVKPQEMFVKIAYDKLTEALGGGDSSLELKPKNELSKILFLGLQGSGKTTTIAKLAFKLKKEGRRPLLVACDLARAAAIEQLEILAESIEVPIHSDREEKDAKKIVKKAMEIAKKEQYDVILVDTAGRLDIDRDLMNELRSIKSTFEPDETILVCDSMIGQKSASIAKEFDKSTNITGVILSKFDSDARGGAALSIKGITGKSIKFIGTGEKVEDLEVFYPSRMASRIMGMGDIVSLVEKAQQSIDDNEAKKLEEKMLKKGLNFEDYLERLNQIKKMGNMKSLIQLIPGAGSIDLDNIDEDEMKREEAVILSMTKKERITPNIIGMSRKKRVALGSGNNLNRVTRLLKNFDKMNSVMKKALKQQGNESKLKNVISNNKKKKKRK